MSAITEVHTIFMISLHQLTAERRSDDLVFLDPRGDNGLSNKRLPNIPRITLGPSKRGRRPPKNDVPFYHNTKKLTLCSSRRFNGAPTRLLCCTWTFDKKRKPEDTRCFRLEIKQRRAHKNKSQGLKYEALKVPAIYGYQSSNTSNRLGVARWH